MVQHALDRGYEVVGVCREQSVENLDAFKERITVVPGATDDRDVIKQAVAGCDEVLVVLVPRPSSVRTTCVCSHSICGKRPCSCRQVVAQRTEALTRQVLAKKRRATRSSPTAS